MKASMTTGDPIGPTRNGLALTAVDQAEVLRSFVHRYTREHVPAWARSSTWKDGKPYPVQFASDRDWLAHTSFRVTKDGRLDKRCRSCVSNPTWPDGVPS